jgi:FkbM family methyltransferase
MSVTQHVRSRARAGITKLLYRHWFAERGNDVFTDIAESLPKLEVRTVFDVGAHVGQSATRYLHRFPHARVYSFEPVKATYQELLDNVGAHPHSVAVNVALGDADTKATIALHSRSDMASLVAAEPGAEGQEVPVHTLDGYCRDSGIERIDYLKIDTEGYDLRVLEGAAGMLGRHAVALVEVEAGISPGNERHVPLHDLKDYLETAGYLAFGFYSQKEEWMTGRPHLRRANVVFVSSTISSENRRDPETSTLAVSKA